MLIPPFDKGRLGGILRSHILSLVGAAHRGRPVSQVGAIHRGHPSVALFPNPGVRGGTPLRNSRGISVLFLIVALLLMVAVGYVLSYLIPTKQKSVGFPIHSSQAFYLAQSGMEYGVRYASENGWRGQTDSGVFDITHLNDSGVSQRNLGRGRFTIGYNSGQDLLTSTGEMTGSEEKRILRVSNFTLFLRLIFDPAYAAPSWYLGGNLRARFYISNVRGANKTLRRFSAVWQADNTRTITEIYIAGTRRWSGNYSSGSPRVSLSSNYTIAGNTGGVEVRIYWSGRLFNLRNIVITLYTGANDDGFTFNLDPEGNGLP